MSGRRGDDGEIDGPVGSLVGPGPERGGGPGLLRIMIGEMDDDPPLREGQGDGRPDEPGPDDERGPHWAMSFRSPAAAPR